MKKKTKGMGAVIILGCLVAGGFYVWQDQQVPADNLAQAQLGAIASVIKETGEIQSHQISRVFSDSSQKVAHVPLGIGDSVQAGDVLLIYDSTEDLAQAQLASELFALKEQYSLSQVARRLELDHLQTLAQEAQTQVEKLKTLAAAGAISEQELTKAQQALGLANNGYLAAENASQLDQSQYQAQQAILAIRLETLAKNQEGLVILAPFSGVITELNVQSGSMTQVGLPVVEIQNPNQLYIKANLLVEDALLLAPGTQVTVADEQAGLYQDQLTVSKIYPKATTTLSALGVEQKRVPVEIDLPSLDAPLPLGADLDLSFVVAQKSDALLVPKTAVYAKKGQYFVQLADKTQQLVTIGIKQGEQIEITSGLTAGQMVEVREK